MGFILKGSDIMKSDYFTKEKTGGSPRLILNEKGKEMIEKLSILMCTDEEIASILGVCVDTLTNSTNKDTFSECKLKGQANGKISLRRAQFKLAQKSAPMAIFLGKNYLGQKDNIEFVDNSEVNTGIANIVKLLNNPIKTRTEEDIKAGD